VGHAECFHGERRARRCARLLVANGRVLHGGARPARKYTIPTEWGAVAPRFRVEYHHDFAGTSTIFLQYADLLRPVYSLTTAPAGRDRASVGAGTDLVIGDRHRLSADYQYDVDFLGADWHRFKLRWESRF
jgi:hypothetical protein